MARPLMPERHQRSHMKNDPGTRPQCGEFCEIEKKIEFRKGTYTSKRTKRTCFVVRMFQNRNISRLKTQILVVKTFSLKLTFD